MVVEDMIAEGDIVVLRYALEGTHEGELFGIPPTGKQLSDKGIAVERISDGKIREHWRVTDELGMMQQLGVIPEQGTGRMSETRCLGMPASFYNQPRAGITSSLKPSPYLIHPTS